MIGRSYFLSPKKSSKLVKLKSNIISSKTSIWSS